MAQVTNGPVLSRETPEHQVSRPRWEHAARGKAVTVIGVFGEKVGYNILLSESDFLSVFRAFTTRGGACRDFSFVTNAKLLTAANPSVVIASPLLLQAMKGAIISSTGAEVWKVDPSDGSLFVVSKRAPRRANSAGRPRTGQPLYRQLKLEVTSADLSRAMAGAGLHRGLCVGVHMLFVVRDASNNYWCTRQLQPPKHGLIIVE